MTPDLTREKILQAAAAEIHRQGFQAASIAHILASTGLTKGALYHHFPSKQALGLAVVDEVIRKGLEERLLNPLREANEPLDTLLAYMDNRIRELTDDAFELGCPLNNLVQEMSPIDEAFKTHLDHILHAWQVVIEQALNKGQTQNRIRQDVDCKAAALFIVSAWEGCWGMAKNRQSAQTFRSCMAQLSQFVLSLAPAA
ncbi:TetR/AcrR family transcriptional regulator [Halothiobacillus sp.]|uniref:TetR/AcrR family transcriptional regulator n=1 Tax=Halothiobacillus sp. TaxID=1891311 RepID=UPI00260D7204|nr:TetR/AcrR family transcriptional regulator [Halothiobacillus sp.]